MSIEEKRPHAVIAFTAMTNYVNAVNNANGWFDSARTFGEDIALLHSEASEMLEAYRDWGTEDMTGRVEGENPNKPLGMGSEAADILIRLLDTCSRYDIDLVAEFDRKMAYNATRGYKHGGKAL